MNTNGTETNETNTTNFKIQRGPQITTTFFDSMFLLLTLWILISFLRYGLKHKKFKRSTSYGTIVYISATTSAFLTAEYHVTKIVSYNLGFNLGTSHACTLATKVSAQSYVIGASSVYLFLWFKQRSLYQNLLLESLNKTWISVASYLSITLMVTGLNAAGVIFNIINSYAASPYGCERVDPFYTWPFLAGSAINALGQSMLLFLFVYPFRFARDKPNTGASVRLLKRSLAVTLLCISTDMVTGLFNTFVPYSVYRTPFIAYGWTATMNLIGVLLTFETWREIVLFLCYNANIRSTLSRVQTIALGNVE